ncbi:hypothetical protein D3C80_1838050 [compost metagenome]
MKESHNSTVSIMEKLGAAASRPSAGYAVTSASRAMVIRTGLRPKRSDRAPPTGSQRKLDIATSKVTSRLSEALSISTFLPKVGAYTVIK